MNLVKKSNKVATVWLDTTLSPELLVEGYVRDFISQVNKMRKRKNYEISDRIDLVIDASEKVATIIRDNEHLILPEVQANSIQYASLTDREENAIIRVAGENVSLQSTKTQ